MATHDLPATPEFLRHVVRLDQRHDRADAEQLEQGKKLAAHEMRIDKVEKEVDNFKTDVREIREMLGWRSVARDLLLLGALLAYAMGLRPGASSQTPPAPSAPGLSAHVMH